MDEPKQVYLVTGSSGLLGHALCHHFGSQNHAMVGFDNAGPPYPPPNTDCLFCDLADDESVQKTFYMVKNTYGGKIKAVFHLAAYYNFNGQESHLYKDITIEGTARMLRELKKFEVGQFIFSSSMLIYKPNIPGQTLSEESLVQPNWAYPRSKVETEKLLQAERGDVPAVSLRIAGVYSDICQSIPIAHQIQRIYENQLEGHLYPGDINTRQSFVHISDVSKAFESVVRNKDVLSGYSTFNIGEAHAMSYNEIQNEISQSLHGKDWQTFTIPKSAAKAGAYLRNILSPTKEKPFIQPWMVDHADDNYELNVDKARQILGWETAHSLQQTLPLMLEGLKVDPLKWYHLNKLFKKAEKNIKRRK